MASGVGAMFTAVSPIQVADGGIVNLEMEDGDTNCFYERGGRIRILRSGTYYAAFTVSVPASVSVDARLALAIGGERIFASETVINSDAFNGNRMYMGQAVFTVACGENLTLESTGALNIPVLPFAAPVIHLSIVRLG